MRTETAGTFALSEYFNTEIYLGPHKSQVCAIILINSGVVLFSADWTDLYSWIQTNQNCAIQWFAWFENWIIHHYY